MATTALSKKKLFAFLFFDDIEVEQNVLNKAQDGDGSSLFKIGQIYYDKSDYTKAIDWFRLGAAKDNPSSQFQIGSMYDHGQDLPVDYKLAMEWYLKAYHNGSIAATNNIGCLYGNAQGVARDYKLALKWFLEAVNKNDSCSQYNVGSYYEKGHGVKVDKQYALEWFEKSDKQGYEEAKSGIKRLNEQGYYIGDRQKRYLQLEKDMEEQKSKIEALESQLEELKQHRLQSDNENKLLKQENKVLKLKNDMDVKKQVTTKEASNQQLEEVISKMEANWVSSSATKNSESDENPENDICYD